MLVPLVILACLVSAIVGMLIGVYCVLSARAYTDVVRPRNDADRLLDGEIDLNEFLGIEPMKRDTDD